MGWRALPLASAIQALCGKSHAREMDALPQGASQRMNVKGDMELAITFSSRVHGSGFCIRLRQTTYDGIRPADMTKRAKPGVSS